MKKFSAFLSAVITAFVLTVPSCTNASPTPYVSGNIGASWFDNITPQTQETLSTAGVCCPFSGYSPVWSV